MMSAAEVLEDAEKLKSEAADTSRGTNEAWVSRQRLQNAYQKLLVMDLEFALDKKVEQELWNHAFKNQISTLQTQSKDKQNQKRGEVQAGLNLFLETASGFYIQLLQEMCSAFNLDLPFRRQSSYIGIIKEYGPIAMKVNPPKRSSCLYICQHCLVHLGDIARYRQQIDQAQAYYRHAARLVPYNGHPYNQLAILEAAKGNKLSTIFFYVRSIAVKHPFPVAATNLDKFYSRISKDSHEHRQKLTVSELIGCFLQLHSFVHLCIDMAKAKGHAEKIITNLSSHIAAISLSSYQLVQMISINLYAIYHARRKLSVFPASADSSVDPASVTRMMNGEKKGNGSLTPPPLPPPPLLDAKSNGELAARTRNKVDIQAYHDLMFDLTISLFDVMLQATTKQPAKAGEYHTMATLKVILDWLRSNSDDLLRPVLKNSSIWFHVARLLNSVQSLADDRDYRDELEKYNKTPLPEDCDLECFLPIGKTLRDLDYSSLPYGHLSEEVEVRLRCQRIFTTGLWIAEEFSQLNYLTVLRLPNGLHQFTTKMRPSPSSGGIMDTTTVERKRQNVAMQALEKMKREATVETSGDSDRKQLNDVTNKTDKTGGGGFKTSQQHSRKSNDMDQSIGMSFSNNQARIDADRLPPASDTHQPFPCSDTLTAEQVNDNGLPTWINKDRINLDLLSQSSAGSGSTMSAASEMNSFSLFDMSGSGVAASPPNQPSQMYQLFNQRPPAATLGLLLRQADSALASSAPSLAGAAQVLVAQRMMQDQYNAAAGGSAMTNQLFYEPVGQARQMLDNSSRYLPIRHQEGGHADEGDMLHSFMGPTASRGPRQTLWTTQQSILPSYPPSEGVQAPVRNHLTASAPWNEKPAEDFPTLQNSFAAMEKARALSQLDNSSNQRWGSNLSGVFPVSSQQQQHPSVFQPQSQDNVRFPLSQQMTLAQQHQAAAYSSAHALLLAQSVQQQRAGEFSSPSTQYQSSFSLSSQAVPSLAGFPLTPSQRQELIFQQSAGGEQRASSYPWLGQSRVPFSGQSGGPSSLITAPSSQSYNTVGGFGTVHRGTAPPVRANDQAFMEAVLATGNKEIKTSMPPHSIDRAMYEHMSNMTSASAGFKDSDTKTKPIGTRTSVYTDQLTKVRDTTDTDVSDQHATQNLGGESTYSLFSQSPWPMGFNQGLTKPRSQLPPQQQQQQPPQQLYQQNQQYHPLSSQQQQQHLIQQQLLLKQQLIQQQQQKQQGQCSDNSGQPFSSGSNIVRGTADERSNLASSANLSSGGTYEMGFSSWPTSINNNGPWNASTGAAAQSLWQSGPSPLEKLLEQQKAQRQSEPR